MLQPEGNTSLGGPRPHTHHNNQEPGTRNRERSAKSSFEFGSDGQETPTQQPAEQQLHLSTRSARPCVHPCVHPCVYLSMHPSIHPGLDPGYYLWSSHLGVTRGHLEEDKPAHCWCKHRLMVSDYGAAADGLNRVRLYLVFK